MKQSSIKTNALMNVIYTITNMVFPLITYPYVNRMLSPTGIGKVTFYTSISQYAIMIASLGISTYGIRAVAKARDKNESLSKVTSELFSINLFFSVLTVIILGILGKFIGKIGAEPLLLLINITIVLATPLGLNWFYSGLEQYAYITKRTIIFKTLSLILVFIFVKDINDYPLYAGIVAFSTIGANICNFIYSKRFVSLKVCGNMNYGEHIKPMLLLFASFLAVNVYNNLDTIMLGFIKGDIDVGYYSIASKTKTLLLSAVNAISAVLLPRLSNYISNHDKHAYFRTLKKSVSVIFIITIPISCFFVLEAFDTIRILGGDDFNQAVLCMQLLMPILVISGFSNVTGNQILIPQGRDSCFLKAVSLGAVVDILLNAVFMPKYGCNGAALATLIAEFFQMSTQVYYAKNDIKGNLQWDTIRKVIIGTVIASIIMVFLKTIISLNYIYCFFISGIVFFGFFGIFMIMTKETIFVEFINTVRIRKR